MLRAEAFERLCASAPSDRSSLYTSSAMSTRRELLRSSSPAGRRLLERHAAQAIDPRQNRLLAVLPEAEWARWQPHLELINMPLGRVLYESGGKLSHVYFPTTAIVSLLYVMEDGASAEIAVVGHDGVVGVSLFMGGESTTSRAVVQSAGCGFRLKSSLMMQEFNRGGPVLHLLLRYTQALITQMAQTAVCNRHHSLDQQLCRWLLLSLDRLQSNELVITQELIASMLGVRREGVTEAAGNLQKDGLIRYRRGHITVLDRAGLEQRTCECYAVVRNEYERLLPSAKAT
jgi:CRP-like cAMP-binding protein